MTFLKIRIFGDGQHVGFVFLVITDTGAWAAGCHNHCCAGVAARMARPEDKELLEQLAQAWEKVAKLRKCDLTDGDEQA
jgi:hypothetical protein